MSEIHSMVRMANQIAAISTRAIPMTRRCRETADHINRFWEPRMRRQILEHLLRP